MVFGAFWCFLNAFWLPWAHVWRGGWVDYLNRYYLLPGVIKLWVGEGAGASDGLWSQLGSPTVFIGTSRPPAPRSTKSLITPGKIQLNVRGV